MKEPFGKTGWGGPAYPVSYAHGRDGARITHTGMTVRDYFAGQVLAGICACAGFAINGQHDGLAETAYKVADAMLKMREIKP